MRFILFLFLFSFVLFEELAARETRYLMRSPYSLLMGDAYTSIVNDDYVLFYNPAGLSRRMNGASIRPLNVSITVMNALDSLDKVSNIPDDTVEMVENFMDFPVHLQMGGSPGFTMGPFGLSLFASTTTNFVIRNSSHPILNLDYRLDRGIVFGYTHKIHESTALGLSVKRINRSGIDQQFHLFGVNLLNKVSEGGDLNQLRKSLGYSSGAGWGFDLGLLSRKQTGGGELSFGLSLMDILNTTYTKSSGEVDIPKQPMIVNSGFGWHQKFFLFDYRLALDMHPLLDSIDTIRKLHIGIDAGTPVLRLLFGWNGGYLSYGLKLRVWPFDLIVGLYGTEIGTSYRQEKGSRAIIYLSLLDFSFDG